MTPILMSTHSQNGRVVTFTLNRPDARNALNEELIAQLTQSIVSVARDQTVRAIEITGSGGCFCAGTDIEWMEGLAAGQADNDARRLANLLYQIRNSPKPVIARINGPAIGAGVGLVAAADIAVSAEDAIFSLPAVRLGVLPAVIGPFLTEAMGIHHTRRYVLTGESFTAMDARHIGLVHAVCIGAHLDQTVGKLIEEITKGGPEAIRETKVLLNAFGEAPPSPGLLKEASKVSARIRKTDEAQEGLRAFVENRLPDWRAGS